MHLIAVSILDRYLEENPAHSDAREPLMAWVAEVKKATWKNPAEIKEKYKNAGLVGNNRVVFNVAGNKYRLIVKINYPTKLVYIRFIGNHQEYNKIKAEEV